MGVDL